tara:strand:+ start:766 stop:1008 length:243 start_codon:yes stop_codon:yes gene_type:complete
MKLSKESVYKRTIKLDDGEYLSSSWVREDGHVYRVILGENQWISTEFLTAEIIDSREMMRDEERTISYWFPTEYKEKLKL